MGERLRAIDHVSLDDETRGWDNIRVFYDGKFVGAIHSRRRLVGWWASVCGINLGSFRARDEAKRAIVEWFAGLDINI
jgi:hypothetical protein